MKYIRYEKGRWHLSKSHIANSLVDLDPTLGFVSLPHSTYPFILTLTLCLTQYTSHSVPLLHRADCWSLSLLAQNLSGFCTLDHVLSSSPVSHTSLIYQCSAPLTPVIPWDLQWGLLPFRYLHYPSQSTGHDLVFPKRIMSASRAETVFLLLFLVPRTVLDKVPS